MSVRRRKACGLSATKGQQARRHDQVCFSLKSAVWRREREYCVSCCFFSSALRAPSSALPVPQNFDRYAAVFRKAQRAIERRHFRDRRILMYHEKERKKLQVQMGQDPYLDTPG